MKQQGWRFAVKRLVDTTAAAALLVATSPALMTAALLVCKDLGRPVLFRQSRAGRQGRPIHIVKLRTMRDAYDASGALRPDAERLTSLGRWLRATSLDELPQLWNVLRGDMSLVGPRPLLMAYLPRYAPAQARRHEVLPGITGWAQVHGRNSLSWRDKFALDVHYVDHWSLALDARILLMTVGRVWQRDGITNGGHATMPEFLGNESAS